LVESWPVGRIASTVDKMPSHWNLVTLTTIAKLESGHTPSRKEPDYWSGNIPWLSLPDSYRLDEIEVNDADGRISPLGIANSSARMLPVGAVLLIRTGGSRGKCSRLAKTMACSQDYVAFVPGPELDSRYLQQVFRHMQREWQRLSDGSTTLRNIFMHAFKRLKILLPPLDEQAAIADVGEAFDLRTTAEIRYLEQLRQTKRGLAQALLSGRLRVARARKARSGGAEGGRNGL
jgi:type I restriction enzyme S subunit